MEPATNDSCRLMIVKKMIKLLERLHSGKRFEGNIGTEHTREVVSSRLDAVSSEGKHGNTAVLEFGGAEPSKGLVTSDGGKVERIEALDWLGASSHGVQVSAKGGAGSLQMDIFVFDSEEIQQWKRKYMFRLELYQHVILAVCNRTLLIRRMCCRFDRSRILSVPGHNHIFLTCRGAGAKAAAVPARARRVKVFMVYISIDIDLYPFE